MWDELAALGKATTIVALCSGLPLLVLLFILGRPRPFLPPYRNLAISWGGGKVLAAFLVCLILVPSIFLLISQSIQGNAVPPEAPTDYVLMLWLAVLAFPFQLGALWILFNFPRGDRLYQIGLARSRLWPDVVRGWSAWLVLSFSVNVLNGFLKAFVPSEDHDLVKIAQQHPLAREWVMIFCAAILVAPIMEELLFRGILQRWLMNRPEWVPFIYLLTFLLALLLRRDQAMKAFGARDWKELFHQLEPACFVLLFLLIPALKSLTPRVARLTARGRVIVATSLLFAIAHAAVWPSPVPLFFLALGLGWLAWRTQSIVPGIIAHSLFNAVACVQLLNLPVQP